MSKVSQLFKNTVKIVNVGLETFYDAGKDQDIETIHVEWKPPAGGNTKLLDILEKLNKK